MNWSSMNYEHRQVNIDSIFSLLGGTIFHFIMGIKILWGNITPYVTSYLVQFDKTVTYHQTLFVYTAIFLGQSFFMYLGGQLEKKIGPRRTCFVGAALVSTSSYLSSYCKSLLFFVLCQALAGVGIGLSYSAPILCGFKYFKQRKGLVTGIITTGTGAGPFFFGLVATTFVNGENYPVDAATGLYDPATSPVVGRVPDMFRLLGIIYAICGFLGASLLMCPNDEDKTNEIASSNVDCGERTPLNVNDHALIFDGVKKIEKKVEPISTTSIIKGRGHQRYGSRVKFTTTFELTTPQMIRDSLCWLIIAAKICVGVPGFYVAATYKSFGLTAISDDHFITVVGCFACLCSGLTRAFWGITADHIGHFRALEIASYLGPMIMIVYTMTVQSKLSYGLSVCLLFALWGAIYCLLPTIATFLFGDKHMGTNYGFIFFVYGVSCTFIVDICGVSGWSFTSLNWFFITIGFCGAGLCSQIRYLTSNIKDEKALKHHRAMSSVGSII